MSGSSSQAKQPATLKYEQRKCAHPGCEKFPNFSYGPPFCAREVWVCREHRGWFEQSQGKSPPDASQGDNDEWVESVMAPVRKQYAETMQPMVRAAAESHRKSSAE